MAHRNIQNDSANTKDLLQFQNESLVGSKHIEFLRSIQPQTTTAFGIKSRARDQDPSMKAIFSWGYEAPVREDYTKDKAEISNKIRKMRREYISECHDNFRKPQSSEDNQLLFNYFD
jgi:hypothetical protein